MKWPLACEVRFEDLSLSKEDRLNPESNSTGAASRSFFELKSQHGGWPGHQRLKAGIVDDRHMSELKMELGHVGNGRRDHVGRDRGQNHGR